MRVFRMTYSRVQHCDYVVEAETKEEALALIKSGASCENEHVLDAYEDSEDWEVDKCEDGSPDIDDITDSWHGLTKEVS